MSTLAEQIDEVQSWLKHVERTQAKFNEPANECNAMYSAILASLRSLEAAEAHKRRRRYFVTDGMHPYERTESEVRQHRDYDSEGDRYTVVEPDEQMGFIIKIGGIQPREWVIDELQEMMRRDFCLTDSAVPK